MAWIGLQLSCVGAIRLEGCNYLWTALVERHLACLHAGLCQKSFSLPEAGISSRFDFCLWDTPLSWNKALRADFIVSPLLKSHCRPSLGLCIIVVRACVGGFNIRVIFPFTSPGESPDFYPVHPGSCITLGVRDQLIGGTSGKLDRTSAKARSVQGWA